jgi:hypothetical protein
MKIHVEVFIASRVLEHMQGTFSPHDMVKFIREQFKDERHGIMTHITAACVANAPLNHPYLYNYLWHLRQGEYRSFRPGYDPLMPEKKNGRTQPEREDVPEKYQYLLRDE